MLLDLSIGKKIKNRREDKKISQIELARLLGTSAAAVCQWETKGTVPRTKTLSKIAHALGVSEQYLTGRDVVASPGPAASAPEEISVAAELDRLKAAVARALGVDPSYVSVEVRVLN
jgi:transcriptional regulator with XRE-family HTH domain